MLPGPRWQEANKQLEQRAEELTAHDHEPSAAYGQGIASNPYMLTI